MKKYRFFIKVMVFVYLFHSQGYAQSFECATDFIHKKLLETDTAYFRKNSTLESQVRNIIDNNLGRLQANTIYSIPVVVHIIHLGEPIGTGTNISDSQVIQAIIGLNEQWRNANGAGADIEMQFCLASRDPNGNSTTGINRVNAAGIANYAAHGMNYYFSNCDAPSEATIKDLSKWPVSDYYNIWVVNKICQGFNGYVGFAYFPFGGVYDGTTIASWVMTREQPVLSHELAHGFNLYHTFEGDGGNASCPLNVPCNSYGDMVCDTPPQKQWDCDSTNPCSTTGTWNNSRYNYMSYCGIRDRFTQGQKDRVRATAIVSPRASLLTSLGCVPVITYTFTGNGNYNVASNWQGATMPPATLPAGSNIVISPSVNGICILNVPQTVSRGAKFTVITGKKINIQGNLRILQ